MEEGEVGKGKARFSVSDARGVVGAGNFTAQQVLKYARGLNKDKEDKGFAGKNAINFLKAEIQKNKRARAETKSQSASRR